jgi:hypothetical protein
MPRHSKEKSSDGAAAGGAGRGTRAVAAAEGGDSKRGVGGRAVGKAALQARRKNAKAVNDFLTMLEGAIDYKELEVAVEREGLRLARVTKMTGCGHMDVQLHDGRAVNLRIAKSVAFKGRAANKGDRENCFLVDDLIVVRDAMAAGKIPVALTKELAAEFERVGAMYPAGFFTRGSEADAGAVGWEFDRESAADRAGACIRGDAAAVEEKAGSVGDAELDVDAI